MNIATLVRQAVKIADSVTKTAQAPVMHYPWLGQTYAGEAVMPSGFIRYAIVEPGPKQLFLGDGRVISTIARLTFLEKIDPIGVAISGFSRAEPIDVRDKFILPDGRTGPIVRIDGMTDPSTSRPYFAEVTLGEPGSRIP